MLKLSNAVRKWKLEGINIIPGDCSIEYVFIPDTIANAINAFDNTCYICDSISYTLVSYD